MADTVRWRQLLGRATALSGQDLWRALTVKEREQGFNAYLGGDTPDELIAALRDELGSSVRGYRPKTVAEWDAARLLREAARLGRPSEHVIRYVFLGLFLFEDRTFQITLFDALRIQHEDGFGRQELSASAPYQEDIDDAVDSFFARHGDDDSAALYLLALATLFRDHWPGLADVIEYEAVHGRDEDSDPDAREILPRGSTEPPVVAPSAPASPRRTRLSELDELLVREMVRVSARLRISGDELGSLRHISRAVNDLLYADPLRHQSYHHLGYLDAMTERGLSQKIPAENEERRRWYLTGWIVARARVKDFSAIRLAYDSDPVVKMLGNEGPATEYAARHVISALVDAGRHGEASRFLSPRALLFCDEALAAQLLKEATLLLRQERGGDGKGYLQLLEDGLALREAAGLDVDPDMSLDVRRRLAHCLRHDGHFEESRNRLQELLTEEVGPRERAMIVADLGLMDSGHTRLSALSMPETPAAAKELAELLGRGLPRFVEADGFDIGEGAHGSYALGILRLLQNDYDDAFGLLDRALAQFSSDPNRYSGGGLIDRAEYFHSIAGLLSSSASVRAEELAARFASALRRGAPLPAFLVENLIIGAVDKNEDIVPVLVAALLERDDGTVLDILHNMRLSASRPQIADALRLRLEQTKQRTTRECALLRTLLLETAALGDFETATRVLGELEQLAAAGTGASEFAEILGHESLTGSILDPDERDAMLIRCLEGQGRYQEAAQVISSLVHRLLAGEQFGALEQAEDLLSQVAAYPDHDAALSNAAVLRIEAMRREAAEAPVPVAVRSARATICIVGGNEVQARYKERLIEWADKELNVDLRMILSGWTSNWRPFLDEFMRLRDNLDGVVVLRFVRTEFGRAVRKQCDGKPQIGTFAHGERGLQRAVLHVTDMARRNLSRAVSG